MFVENKRIFTDINFQKSETSSEIFPGGRPGVYCLLTDHCAGCDTCGIFVQRLHEPAVGGVELEFSFLWIYWCLQRGYMRFI